MVRNDSVTKNCLALLDKPNTSKNNLLMRKNFSVPAARLITSKEANEDVFILKRAK